MPDRILHRLVIRDVAGGAVFVVRDGSGWRLPSLRLEDQHTAVVEHVNAAVAARWGLATTVLRGLAHIESADGAVRAHVLEMQADSGRRTADSAWLPVETDLVHALPRGDAALVRGALADSGEADGCDWARPGWWPEVRAWIEAEVGAADVVQLRAWQSSCVARVRATDTTVYYFKALPLSAAKEARVTEYLSRHAAPGAPAVVAADLERRWLLMRGFAGVSLDDSRDLAFWERGLSFYAQLQAATWNSAAELRALGCGERTPNALAAAVDPLLADTAALMPAHPQGLTQAQVEELRRRAPQLERDCFELAGIGLPPALDHGDLWPSNILVNERACTIIDWEDAALALPFSSLAPFLTMVREWNLRLELERVADVYLPALAAVQPHADLRHAFMLALPLAFFEMAVRYWRMPPEVVALHPWMREMVPLFLRRVLEP